VDTQNLDRLRRLAEYVRDGAGELYDLEWKPTERTDNFGVCPRILIGGMYSSHISLGCWSKRQAPVIQQLAEYLAMLDPNLILELLDNAGHKLPVGENPSA